MRVFFSPENNRKVDRPKPSEVSVPVPIIHTQAVVRNVTAKGNPREAIAQYTTITISLLHHRVAVIVKQVVY